MIKISGYFYTCTRRIRINYQKDMKTYSKVIANRHSNEMVRIIFFLFIPRVFDEWVLFS